MLKYRDPELYAILHHWPVAVFLPAILLLIASLAMITRWWDKRDEAARQWVVPVVLPTATAPAAAAVASDVVLEDGPVETWDDAPDAVLYPVVDDDFRDDFRDDFPDDFRDELLGDVTDGASGDVTGDATDDAPGEVVDDLPDDVFAEVPDEAPAANEDANAEGDPVDSRSRRG